MLHCGFLRISMDLGGSLAHGFARFVQKLIMLSLLKRGVLFWRVSPSHGTLIVESSVIDIHVTKGAVFLEGFALTWRF